MYDTASLTPARQLSSLDRYTATMEVNAMNAHFAHDSVLQLTVNQVITILDPINPVVKQRLPIGTIALLEWCEVRTGHPWLLLLEHDLRGLSVHAFRKLWEEGLVEVEQKTAGNWEDYFDEN